jgi:hypothetical protein
MRTLEFTWSLREIVKELRVQELAALLEQLLTAQANQAVSEPIRNQFSALLFASHAGYEKLKQSADTRRILEQMEVGRFYDPGALSRMIAGLSTAQNLQQIQTGAGFAAFNVFLELLRSFKRIEATCTTLLEKEKIGESSSSDGIFQMELIEYADESGISPQRIEVFLENIVALHTALTRIYGIATDTLKVKYLDSGSNFIWGLECAKPIAEAISTLLTQWWDRLRFWQIDGFERRLDAISKGLKVADEIHQSVEKGIVDQETADNLKVRIFQNVENLLGVGATVPLPRDATVNQRQLLTEMRNTKLLGTGTPEERPNGEPSAESPQTLA